LATRIVVASSYTKQTLVAHGVPVERIVVNPYGVDLDSFVPPKAPRSRQPLRFLFLGAISARKGVPLLVEAWRTLALSNAELWLVGSIEHHQRALIPDLPGLNVMGKFPFEQLPDLLRRCDVLVFPSYCEGFALVLLEALASGMPIITTEATAGPDLIGDKREGLLIPSGNIDALREAIKYFLDQPDRLEEMSLAARACAERFSWDSYGDRWQRILEEVV
jgi:glycosyltransferase involved in cell wall biosynthesis